MTEVHLFSEPYNASGNIDARAAGKALGQPRLPHWHIFLRETLQNSWDARLSESGTIDFRVEAWTPATEEAEALASFFRVTPSEHSFVETASLREFLDELEDSPVLTVTDRRTRGLGGPTRADRHSEESTDFVDFVRNVGRDAAKNLGGGTYGFGKGILWRSSCCATVVAYSRTRSGGELVSRLIGICLGAPFYDEDGRRYTGRHWWGVPDAETGAEPLTGEMADQWAQRMGFDAFRGDDTGTSLMVLGPVVDDEGQSLQDVMRQIEDAVLWWAWPHLVDGTAKISMAVEREEQTLADPDDHPRLKHFTNAYRRSQEAGETEWPWHSSVLQSPGLGALGSLVWRNYPAPAEESDQYVPDGGVSNHIALMRTPRFIVRYRAVADDPGGQSTAGVFVAADDWDSSFARSEPVAHDDWSSERLPTVKSQRNPVRIALNRIDQRVKDEIRAGVADPEDGAALSGLTRLASRLGGLVGAGVDARVKERAPSQEGGSGTGGRSTRTLKVVGAELALVDGEPAVWHDVECVADEAGLVARIQPMAVLEGGGAEVDGAARLVAVEMNGSGARLEDRLVIPEGAHTLRVAVAAPPESAVALALSWEEETE